MLSYCTFQRPYAWTQTKAMDLFDNLYDFYQKEEQDSCFLEALYWLKMKANLMPMWLTGSRAWTASSRSRPPRRAAKKSVTISAPEPGQNSRKRGVRRQDGQGILRLQRRQGCRSHPCPRRKTEEAFRRPVPVTGWKQPVRPSGRAGCSVAGLNRSEFPPTLSGSIK